MVISVRRDTIISSFKRIPRGLLIVMVLLLMTEGVLYLIRPNLITNFWDKFLINEHVLLDMPGDYKYLIMGDSIQKTGIDPTKVSEKILNLGLPGAKPMGLYLLLKRYLRKHSPPKAIFLYIDPEESYDSRILILKYFTTLPETASIWRDLTWKEKGEFLLRYWVSFDTRKNWVTMIGRRARYPHANSVFISEMKKNRGYMPFPNADKEIAEDFFTKTGNRRQDKVSITERDMKYLDKFMELASSKNIKIVLLGLFIPEELHYILSETGFEEDYMKFLRRVARLYPNTYIVEEPITYLFNDCFGDMSHVNHNGSLVYTEYFKKQAFLPAEALDEPSPSIKQKQVVGGAGQRKEGLGEAM